MTNSDISGKGGKVRDNERLTMTISELAAAIGCSRYLAYSLARQNKLPVNVIRLGDKRMVVSRKAVLDLLKAKDTEVGVTNNG